MRLGLFGGTFDPIHNGHLQSAKLFADELNLEQVIFLPAGQPYHKQSTQTSAEHRLAMVSLAINIDERFAVSDCDMIRKKNTYTIDTVNIFREIFPKVQLWWLMGMDTLLTIHHWYQYQKLLSIINIAVCMRDNASLQQLDSSLHQWLSDALDKAKCNPDGVDGGRVHFLLSVSYAGRSSDIRQYYQHGQYNKAEIYLPDSVVSYIHQQHLYQIS